MKPILSICIPVYNCETFVEKCLISIIKSKYFDKIEVILVNDMSPDKSKNICTRYSKKYSNILLYNNPKNMGEGATRNKCLQKVSGNWVYFLDSDDKFIDFDFESICQANNDIILGLMPASNFKWEKENMSILGSIKYARDNWLNHFAFICKKEFLDKHNLLFIENKKFGADLNFAQRILICNPQIRFVNQHFMKYNFNPSSITATKSIQIYKNIAIKSITESLSDVYYFSNKCKNEISTNKSLIKQMVITNIITFTSKVMIADQAFKNTSLTNIKNALKELKGNLTKIDCQYLNYFVAKSKNKKVIKIWMKLPLIVEAFLVFWWLKIPRHKHKN